MEINAKNLVKWLQLNHPKVVKAMSEANHHYKAGEVLNPYHLEGDVWTHNMMVVLEAEKLKSKLDEKEYIHTLVAALLHDIGKPAARKENHEKQRVHFWGHEPISAFMSVHILDQIEKDFKVNLNKRLIIEAIAMHTDVYNVPREKLADRLVNNIALAKLLSNLSECDYAGRFFEMGERDMAAIEVRSNKLPSEAKNRVICLVGLPCSGKSTFLEKAVAEDDRVLSRDAIIMEVAAEMGITTYNEAFNKVDQKEIDKRFNILKNKLTKHEGTVWIDMTNMSRKSRRKNLQGFSDHKKEAIVFMIPWLEIADRNKNREGKYISSGVYEMMMTSFQPPLYDEFDEIVWVV